ncbi:MAG TPA: ATP-grasp domain-containing protein, partial [Phycisphaeraceae bacterium]
MWRVLVFPSCNEPGLEIIEALARSNKVQVLGGSSYDLETDPSRHLLAEHLRCPDFHHPRFEQDLRSLLREHRVDMVFPTMDVLVAAMADYRVEGVTFITPEAQVARLLCSKRATYQQLAGVAPTPRLYDRDDQVTWPAYAKPDRGAGSRGHLLIEDQDDLAYARRKGLLVMEHLPGPEYTVDCLGDLDGRLLVANPRRRDRIGRGIALGSVATDEHGLRELTQRIAQRLRIAGPWFAQFKLDRDGQPRLMEVNARVGGSMGLTRLAGVNIPLLAVFIYQGVPVRVPTLTPGLRVNRCLRNLAELEGAAWVVWDWDDTLLRKDGKADPEAVAALVDCHNRGLRQLLLTRNSEAQQQMAARGVPALFEQVICAQDKVAAMRSLLAKLGCEASAVVMVNDSNT